MLSGPLWHPAWLAFDALRFVPVVQPAVDEHHGRIVKIVTLQVARFVFTVKPA
jgi:hypothetical protein